MDPDERMNPEQALSHPWIKMGPDTNILHSEVLMRLKKFQAPRMLQKEVLLYMANTLQREDIE